MTFLRRCAMFYVVGRPNPKEPILAILVERMGKFCSPNVYLQENKWVVKIDAVEAAVDKDKFSPVPASRFQ